MIESFELAPGVRAGATPDDPQHDSDGQIEFVIDGVRFAAGPALPLRETVGSSAETGEELSFSRQTGLPSAGYLSLRASNLPWHDWQQVAAIPRSGQLRLLEPKPFTLVETQLRALDPGGSALVAVLPGVVAHHVEARVRLVPGLDVLVAQGRYGGWMLADPIRRLRWDAAEPPSRAGSEPVHDDGSEPPWLAGLFALMDDRAQERLQRGDAALVEALEALGEQVDGAARTLAGWAILARIEDDLREGMTSERLGARNLAVARDLVTGKMYTAKDRGAMARRSERIHPVIVERVRAERALVELHRDLRRAAPPGFSPGNQTTASIAALIRANATALHDLFQQYGVPAMAGGISCADQFVRLNTRIRALEQRGQRPDGTLPLRHWLAFRDAIGNHAEVLAVSEALLQVDAPAAATDAPVDSLQRLELHIERLARGGPVGTAPVVSPRCVHCSFITHGVLPTEALLEKERAAALSLDPS